MKMEWIPYNHGDKINEGDYLVTTENLYMSGYRYSPQIGRMFPNGHWNYGNVVAYMPMPEPYRTDGVR